MSRPPHEARPDLCITFCLRRPCTVWGQSPTDTTTPTSLIVLPAIPLTPPPRPPLPPRYAMNDPEPNHRLGMNCPARRAFERLLRQLLRYPRRPAVALLQSYSYFWHRKQEPQHGYYWAGPERELNEIGGYYRLPVLSESVKACCYHLMRQGACLKGSD